MADATTNHLKTEARTTFGKGVARKIRATGKIPAVIYGHGTEPVHVTLPGHETALILRKSNQVLELDVDGKTHLALVKDVQKDPVRQIIEHIDLIVIRKGEKVQVEVNVHLEGEPAPGLSVQLDANTLLLEVEATHIPEFVTVNVDNAEAGVHIHAKEITLPAGSVLISDPDMVVVVVAVPAEQDLGEVAETPAEAEAEASAEGADEVPAEDAE